MQFLCQFQDVYSQYKYDFDVIDIPFQITLKPDAELKKQRITKVPTHYRDQIQQILDDLEQNCTIKRVGINVARNNEFGPEFINPIIILPKGDTYKTVTEATTSQCHN